MADSAIAKWIARQGVSFATRYGLALASVTGALLLELLFHHFNLPHPFAAFALSAIAITFWYGRHEARYCGSFAIVADPRLSRPKPAASPAFFMIWCS
jgi:hypothetical protein